MKRGVSALVLSSLLGVVLTTICVAASLPFTTVHRGSVSKAESVRQITVRSAAEWTALWNQQGPDAPLPAVDFSRFMVIGVFLGTRPTGGYSVEITNVSETGEEIVVTYRERRPGPNDMVSQALTSPVHLVTVPLRRGEIRFNRADGRQ